LLHLGEGLEEIGARGSQNLWERTRGQIRWSQITSHQIRSDGTKGEEADGGNGCRCWWLRLRGVNEIGEEFLEEREAPVQNGTVLVSKVLRETRGKRVKEEGDENAAMVATSAN